MMSYIKKFSEISIKDLSEVGGKNASLGEMYNKLASQNIAIPNGFAVTSSAFKHFIAYNKLDGVHTRLMADLDRKNFSNLKQIGEKARELILHARISNDLIEAISFAYSEVFANNDPAVAVRSSATAEDLPEASFAGQHESYLNISGNEKLILAVKKCFASLYTDRAIKYREDKGFDHSKVFLSVGIQEMVRADKGCSGVGFTLDPDSGFAGVIHFEGVWGLGENMVQGTVNPDEFLLFKTSLRKKKFPIIQKKLGSKQQMMVYADDTAQNTNNITTPSELQNQFILNDEEITLLGNWALIIEDYYKKPMDIEWAKDGLSGELFILQARPETVHSQKKSLEITEFKLLETKEPLLKGQAIGSKIISGKARIIQSPEESDDLEPGDILVTNLTSPDWDPILKTVSAIITNKGGRTSHASIIARELGVPAIVGTANATELIKDGQTITVNCAEGNTGLVYDGVLTWEEKVLDFKNVHLPNHPQICFILGDPEKAFNLSFYPNNGVGLMRMEFIISHQVKIHPMALVNFNTLKNLKDKKVIRDLTQQYPEKGTYFIDKLAEGIAIIAAAFYPKDVIVRMSDFKTNEYANLLGGKEFEPEEENPMLGFRGASRYYNDLYKPGFKLECEAVKRVRDDMGLDNVKLMIPFCRTPDEGEKVIELMKTYGLVRGKNKLEIYVMAEIPSNILLAEELAGLFDGFSIGSNDLTQLILGVDRDSALVASLFDENNLASKEMIKLLIQTAHKCGSKVGICGQGPGDSVEFAQFLVEEGIDSISFNPDMFLKGLDLVSKLALQHEMR
ncbi:phosphoenolpyruvate synthase [Pedobacter cryophilus]|uniref:Phosphoenolpyruvate synthase n=2 Tax=Pedobacter cryophilus TaxID=2571271 RepID=A0A4U1C3Z8_9SPHI|nr:phosphoenolpyruvate synthase [Pedobacter cryophilus]